MLDQTALCDKMTGFEMRGEKWMSLTQTLAMFSAVSPPRLLCPSWNIKSGVWITRYVDNLLEFWAQHVAVKEQ